MKNRFIQSVLIALFASVFSFSMSQFGLLKTFENRLWDLRVTYLSKPNDHNPAIKLILIDQSSLDWASKSNGLSWPWPREMYTAILDYCHLGGAKVVAMDILYTEPSIYGVNDDERFAQSIKRSNSIGTVVLSDTQGLNATWPPFLYQGMNVPALKAKVYHKATFPVEPLGSAYRGLGFVLATPDEDGIVRRADLVNTFDGKSVPSLALASYLAAHVPLHGAYKASGNIINYHGASQTYASVNAAAVIQSKLLREKGQKGVIPAEFFKDSYVFIGVSAPGLMDLKSTPTQAVYPGVEIHATVLDNLLSSNFITKSPTLITLVLLGTLTFLLAFGILLHTSIAAVTLYVVSGFLIVIAAGIYGYGHNSWLDLSMLITGIILSSSGAFSVNYKIEGNQRRFIKNAFSRYLSPKVIDLLIAHPETLKLGGRRETLTILFSDIEGFTTLCTHLEPEAIAHFLNDYLGLMSDTIMDLGGTIDKYEGDAIIAFWNAPLAQSDHAILAVKAALTCQKLLQQHQARFVQEYAHEIKTRFGIHTGEVIIGNLGTQKRFDFTFIGDAGNLASRLESANKQFGSYIMISEMTKSALKEVYYCRQLGTLRVVGRSSALDVFEPMERDEAAKREEWLPQYEEALKEFYHGDLEVSRERFWVISNRDNVSKTYVTIVDKIKSGEMELDKGVLRLSEK
ncbi:MAG: adenylate cyclase [Campylobacterota bacterium]|nr:adenylate cyclase [Campylobacterota bacterium]